MQTHLHSDWSHFGRGRQLHRGMVNYKTKLIKMKLRHRFLIFQRRKVRVNFPIIFHYMQRVCTDVAFTVSIYRNTHVKRMFTVKYAWI